MSEVRARVGSGVALRAAVGEPRLGEGPPGWTPRLQRTETAVQLRYESGEQLTEWVDLVPLTLLSGEDGFSVDVEVSETHIRVRSIRADFEGPWVDLVSLESLRGRDGRTAFQLAVAEGFQGSLGQWLASLKGEQGDKGLSAYQLWVKAGNVGTVVEFLESLKGESPELPSFVASSTVGVVGSVPTVAAEEVDGEVRFRFVLPPPRDGVSPPPLSLSVTSSEVAQGQPMTASLSGSYPNLTLALGLRAGSPGTQGGVGPQGASGMPNVDLVGTGMPNGVVTAAPGTIYRDTAGTNGAWLWIKKTGTNSQGWFVEHGDTGKRRLTLPAGWNGTIDVQRFGNGVTLSVANLWLETGTSSTGPTRPAGFRPPVDRGSVPLYMVRSMAAASGGLVFFGERFDWSGATRATAENNGGYLQWATADQWPVGALPGTPA